MQEEKEHGFPEGNERRMTTMKSVEEFKQEALQAIKDMGGFPYNPDIYWSYRAVKDIPVWKEQYFHPSIDAVPVIRCKDCKYQEKYYHEDRRRKDGGYYIYGCELADGYSHVCLDDDFCSRAEREESCIQEQ